MRPFTFPAWNAGRRSRSATIVAFLVIAGLLVAYVSGALATTPSGLTSTPLAPLAQFGEIDSKDHSVPANTWQAMIKTKGVTDFYVTQFTIQPGGNGGWHSHPGPTFLIVKSGTLSFYQGDDPTCTAQVLTPGSGVFEQAGLVHLPRNEGSQTLELVGVQLIQTGEPRRIDEPRPGNCPF